MTWPTHTGFSSMLQSPQAAFKDKSLHTLEIQRDKIGLPKARAGNFAVVYCGIRPNQDRIAIRAFSSGKPERQERYKAIYDHLEKLNLSFLVPFTYSDKGLRADDGRWYPLITMDWVKGDTLFDWLNKTAGANNAQPIKKICEKWRDMIKALNDAEVAHGDLQHANIMIDDKNDIKLVDYDGMCVPGIAGRQNEEIGVDPYQHRERDGNTKLYSGLDNFSAVFIYLGLRALAADPSLWTDFVVRTQYDKMLFKRSDFDDPQSSVLMNRLKASPDQEVVRLSELITRLWHGSINDVPQLDQLLFSFDQVVNLLNNKDFEAALALLKRNKKTVNDAPPSVQAGIRNAQERFDKKCELEVAIKKGDERKMATLITSPLLKDYLNVNSLLALAADAPTVVKVIERLDAATSTNQWRQFVTEWDRSQDTIKRPKGDLRTSVLSYKPLAHSWREKNQLCDIVNREIANTNPTINLLKTTWEDLQSKGGHPEHSKKVSDINLLIKREIALAKFLAIPRTVNKEGDDKLIHAWQEQLFSGWHKSQSCRSDYDSATKRLSIFSNYSQACSKTPSYSNEKEILGCYKSLPKDYSSALTKRADVTQQRLSAFDSFNDGLKADSDIKITKSFHALDQLKGSFLLDRKVQDRLQLAKDRHAHIQQFKDIPTEYQPSQANKYDPILLEHWDEELLHGSRDAAPWAAISKDVKKRWQLSEELNKAVAKNNIFQALKLSAEPLFKNYPFNDQKKAYLIQAQADAKSVSVIESAIKNQNFEKFLSAFDSKVINEQGAFFAPLATEINTWMNQNPLLAKSIGLTPPVGAKALVITRTSHRKCALRWRWPEARFSNECRITVGKKRPQLNDSPETIPAFLRLSITREVFEKAGGFRVVNASSEWGGAFVAIWSTIEILDEVFWSEPLILGKI